MEWVVRVVCSGGAADACMKGLWAITHALCADCACREGGKGVIRIQTHMMGTTRR